MGDSRAMETAVTSHQGLSQQGSSTLDSTKSVVRYRCLTAECHFTGCVPTDKLKGIHVTFQKLKARDRSRKMRSYLGQIKATWLSLEQTEDRASEVVPT